jgi:hypothetical protein
MMKGSAAVDLVRFEAKWQNDGSILVAWETSSELDSSAFFLYRAEDAGGPWTDYIDFEPAAGNEFMGATYTFADHAVRQGATYYYRLEEVTNDGASSFHGPIISEGPGLLRTVFLPFLDASAAMHLLKFEAKWQHDGSILVIWETASEIDLIAFFLYRAESPDGPWNNYLDFEPATGSECCGATYAFVDNEARQGRTYYYRLEEVGTGGTSNWYGPIHAGPGLLNEVYLHFVPGTRERRSR